MQVNVFFMHAILHRDCDMFNIVLLVLFSEGQKFSHKNQNYFRRSELFIKGFLYFLHDHIQITHQITIVLRVGPSCCRPSIEELFVDISKTCQKRIWLPFTSSSAVYPTNSIENKQPNTDIKLNIKETESYVRDTNNLENK